MKSWTKEMQDELQAARKKVQALEQERNKHLTKFKQEWGLNFGETPLSVDMLFGAKELVVELLSSYID